MADLHKDRVTPNPHPLNNVGVDCLKTMKYALELPVDKIVLLESAKPVADQ